MPSSTTQGGKKIRFTVLTSTVDANLLNDGVALRGSFLAAPPQQWRQPPQRRRRRGTKKGSNVKKKRRKE